MQELRDRGANSVDGALFSYAIVGIGPTVCIKVRRNFHIEDTFQLSDICDWQSAFGDFEKHLDEHLKRKRIEEI